MYLQMAVSYQLLRKIIKCFRKKIKRSCPIFYFTWAGVNMICCYCIPSFVWSYSWIHYLESKNLLLSHVHKHTLIKRANKLRDWWNKKKRRPFARVETIPLSELRLNIWTILCASEEHVFHIIKVYLLPVATHHSFGRVSFILILMLNVLLFVTPRVLNYYFASSIVFLIWCSFNIGN